jgi:hypothetical protein
MKIPKSVRVYLFSFLIAIPLAFILQACSPDEDALRQTIEEGSRAAVQSNENRITLYDCIEDGKICLYLTSKHERITYLDRCAILVTKTVRNGVASYETDLFCDADS